ncbi:MAG: serine acetyltransferase [Candidatus Latescibacterota bacterium]|nr:MAG: serine acetyltransferase [Candidatus Latescibacterota bacterium]
MEITDRLGHIAEEIAESYDKYERTAHLDERPLPSREVVLEVLQDLLRLLFPGYLGKAPPSRRTVKFFVRALVDSIYVRLSEEAEKALLYEGKRSPEECRKVAQESVLGLLEKIPELRRLLWLDVQAAYDGDPAAKSHEEVMLSYPCIIAIATYRVAHELYERGIPLIPRMMTEWAHSQTGIDIHPGARIGERFFIDHGTGVVIGETTEIGDEVKIYQGVTLGALSFPKGPDGKVIKGGKRHPTIEDGVTIYAEATILGGETKIGKGSVIGGNVWLTSSVPPGTKVTVTPKLEFQGRQRKGDG